MCWRTRRGDRNTSVLVRGTPQTLFGDTSTQHINDERDILHMAALADPKPGYTIPPHASYVYTHDVYEASREEIYFQEMFTFKLCTALLL